MSSVRPSDPTVRLDEGREAPPPTFESVALERGFVTVAQVTECQALHQKLVGMMVPSTLWDVFLMRGYLTKDQVAEIHAALGTATADAIPGYKIVEKIAEGGMGAVYKAMQKSMNRTVALKVLLPRFAAEEDGRARFTREAHSVAQLSHPNIVAGIDAGVANGLYYFVMEYLDGETLAARLVARRRLPWREAAEIVRQIARAIEHAHAHGMVHRDIKPGNIILQKDGTAKLADLGLARITSTADPTLTQSGMIVGSPAYVSPEQATGAHELDVRSDIYSLGLTFFECLAGERAYNADNPMTLMNARLSRDVPFEKLKAVDAPRDVVAIIAKMTYRDAAGRYATPQQLLADLDSVLGGSSPANTQLPRRKPPVAAGVAAALAILVAGGFIVRTLRAEQQMAPPVVMTEDEQFVLRAAQAKLTMSEAIERALAKCDGEIVDVTLESGGTYKVDFVRGTMTRALSISAIDGAIVLDALDERDDKTDVAGKSKTTLPAAVKTALEFEPGRAVEAEVLSLQGGRIVVQVRVVRDGRVETVDVDGETGKVVLRP
jgi:serine/threonine-protein kinase